MKLIRSRKACSANGFRCVGTRRASDMQQWAWAASGSGREFGGYRKRGGRERHSAFSIVNVRGTLIIEGCSYSCRSKSVEPGSGIQSVLQFFEVRDRC